MRRFIPSIGSLVAFESVAKHLSFSRAANELALTQSAVSRQIKVLEDQINVQLFERLPHNLILTEAGEKFLPEVVEALELLSTSTANMVNFQDGRSVIRISCTPTLASRVLIPALVEFHRLHPGITVDLVTKSAAFNLAETNLDMAINMGSIPWPGMTADPLFTSPAIVVGSKEYIRRANIRTLADMSRAQLIHISPLSSAWQQWLTSAGVEHPAPMAGWHLEQFQYGTDAALAGSGLALLPRLFVKAELQRGDLQEMFAGTVAMDFTYLLILRPDRRSSQAISTFRKWLLNQKFE
ncbi:LysR substrate-binding domain-containing protein [Mesorhizobium sp. CAU 1732]|uniref:LysR substrate-binding domain-containing protein n=1 Tax=Mesorhizobium sp. CAU 1732 TaxID=3140358 RepID=UPI0032603F0F